MIVSEKNCLETAGRIVSVLEGKTFNIMTCTFSGGEIYPKVSVIRGRVLAKTEPGGFTQRDGRTSIQLSPGRTIFWDLGEGEVTVEFQDNGVVILERMLPHGKKICRVVLY